MKATTSPASGHWTNTTLSDVMEQSPATWMDTAVPGWRNRTYGDYFLRTSPADWWSMMYPTLAGRTQPAPRRHPHHHPDHHRHDHHHHDRERDCGCHEHDHRHHDDCGCHEHDHHHHDDCGCHEHHHRDCGCHDCAHASCECECCIGDVDITVYTRVGEERVVPMVIENERRRESRIKLELSNWTTRAGNPAPVETVRLEPVEFTIEPCGSKEVTLAIKVAAPHVVPVEGEGREPTEEPRDVDACLVVTADMRLEGCDHRPVRIAAAILPRYCDPCRVGCGCSCC